MEKEEYHEKHRTNHRVWSEHSGRTRRVEDHLCAIDAYLRVTWTNDAAWCFLVLARAVTLQHRSRSGGSRSHLILLAVGGGWSRSGSYGTC